MATFKKTMSELMSQAWQLVKRYGFTLAEAMKKAWQLLRLKQAMQTRIVKFFYQKVDGSVREAYGTLKASLLPSTAETESKRKSDTVQTYYDTERQNWRSFKKANFIKLV